MRRCCWGRVFMFCFFSFSAEIKESGDSVVWQEKHRFSHQTDTGSPSAFACHQLWAGKPTSMSPASSAIAHIKRFL